MILQYKFSEDYRDKVFFTSDTHFYHKNILKYCGRLFQTIEEMNEMLIENWNRKVSSDDIVFHLGDFCFGGAERWTSVRNRLNGQIVLVVGNHDMSSIRPMTLTRLTGTLFYDICMQTSVKIGSQLMILSHYPMLSYSGMYENRTYDLFGHVHLRPGYSLDYESQLKHLRPCQYDVGVDLNGFCPVSFSEVRERISEQIRLEKNCLMWTM